MRRGSKLGGRNLIRKAQEHAPPRGKGRPSRAEEPPQLTSYPHKDLELLQDLGWVLAEWARRTGLPATWLAPAINVSYCTMVRFLAGLQGLSLLQAGRLMQFLGVQLVRTGVGGPKWAVTDDTSLLESAPAQNRRGRPPDWLEAHHAPVE